MRECLRRHAPPVVARHGKGSVLCHDDGEPPYKTLGNDCTAYENGGQMELMTELVQPGPPDAPALSTKERLLLALHEGGGRADGGELTQRLDAVLGPAPRELEREGLVRCVGRRSRQAGGAPSLVWELTSLGQARVRGIELRTAQGARQRLLQLSESVASAGRRIADPPRLALSPPGFAPKAMAVETLGWRDLVSLLVRLAGLPVAMYLGPEAQDQPAFRVAVGERHGGVSAWYNGVLLVRYQAPWLVLGLDGGDDELVGLCRPMVHVATVVRDRSFVGDSHLTLETDGATFQITISDAITDSSWMEAEYYRRPVPEDLYERVAAADPFALTRLRLLREPITQWPVPHGSRAYRQPCDWQPNPAATLGRPLGETRRIVLP